MKMNVTTSGGAPTTGSSPWISGGLFRPARHGQQCTNKKDAVPRAMKFEGKTDDLKG
jgi:hypothetical protein